MRIAFVVNDVETEEPGYTTTRLARTAAQMGHEVWLLGVADFIYNPDGCICAHARGPSSSAHASLEDFLEEIQGEEARCERITLDHLDAVLLRNDPSADQHERPWAQSAGILFGELAATRGVMVLNDPKNLANAINKTYFQHFPEQVRPQTCISRHPKEIKDFIASHGNNAVLKPLQGSGGHSVFLVKEGDKANVNQMIEAVLRDGYCIVQEYLPAATEGDIRLFVMNGRPLMRDGKYAAFRRVNREGDMRSNMHSGGESEAAEITPVMLDLVEMVRPKLIQDGMFLVGLDIVEDKLMEINVFSPGGLGSAERTTGVDFTREVIEDLERKTEYHKHYGPRVPNATLATL